MEKTWKENKIKKPTKQTKQRTKNKLTNKWKAKNIAINIFSLAEVENVVYR